uniref:Uncharacterized protein n=1 Tax=Denticeps clupeoides TaxID=299321 RepID=A0AAY4D9V3_9TELE
MKLCLCPGAGLVKVRVQHPPEASVKIHQVIKVGHGPTAREQSETVTWSAGLSGARTSVLPGERAEAPPPIVQAQTIRGDATYTESSGFKYCFREVRNGQCSSPLPGLRSQETCCRGVGRAWGINDCTLCPANTENFANGEGSCPKGFERINGTQCVDVNECSEPGICENGDCVNTRGSYTCVCRPGYLLDTSHGICISHKVISEEKHQCYRVVSAGVCSLPILKNITKQICCCSRVGKAWGRKCETCPFFGSAAFKEICPAGPGYHYSANNLQINQRLVEYHSTGQQVLVSNTGASAAPDTRPQQPDRINPQVPQARPHQPTSTGSLSPEAWPQQPSIAPNQTEEITHLMLLYRFNSVLPESPVCESRPQICGAGRCVDQPGGRHTCLCDPGHQLNAQRTQCQDINECLLTPGLCPVGVCENTPGSYRCSCPSGFQTNFQQTQCQDVDECRQVPNPCICSNGRCENTPGSFRCACRNGYRQEGDRCTDVDECSQTPRVCANGRCKNAAGGYRCECYIGFQLQDNVCTDINECEDPLQCPGQQCVNSQGSYRCVPCRVGYSMQNGKCSDVDECQGPQVCGPESLCVNTDGSYHCECKPGYRALGQQCRDINECMEGEYCFPRGECINTKGSYRCQCAPGYRTGADGTSCLDEDECARPGVCQDGHCVNSEGSFQCRCQAGFTTNPEKTACLGKYRPIFISLYPYVTPTSYSFTSSSPPCLPPDVDECVDSEGAVCGTQRCENTIGSYRCFTSCEPGYRVTATGECVDVNECANETVCGKHSFCQNLIGTYQCMCDQGYVAAGDAGGCVDENECETMQGVCGTAHCENVEGSFMCDCPNPEEVFNPRSGQCIRHGGQWWPSG